MTLGSFLLHPNPTRDFGLVPSIAIMSCAVVNGALSRERRCSEIGTMPQCVS